MKKPFFLLLLLSCLSMSACAGFNKARVHLSRESNLLKAGFKPIATTTPEQEKQLKLLPSGKITTLTRQGKTYYVYPDKAHHQILVGKNKQLMQYNELATQELSPFGKPSKMDRDWEESGLWDTMGGWDSVIW